MHLTLPNLTGSAAATPVLVEFHRARPSTTGLWLALAITFAAGMTSAAAQSSRARPDDSYRPPAGTGGSLGTLPSGSAPQGGSQGGYQGQQPAAPTGGPGGYNQPTADYGAPLPNSGGSVRNDGYRGPDGYQAGGAATPPGDYGPTYGAPYSPPPTDRYDRPERGAPNGRSGQYAEDAEPPYNGTYSRGEIADAGGRFFGSITKGLASAIEYTYKKAGRPNGYILGEDAGGAFIGGLRYGEGTLYTKDAGTHKVYWQGPSLGYDVGGEGSKTMVLVYNLRDVSDLYERFGGVEGSAYLVGGVSVQFQKRDDVILAPIRSGVGLRLGANVGYLKYTRKPTWNPF